MQLIIWECSSLLPIRQMNIYQVKFQDTYYLTCILNIITLEGNCSDGCRQRLKDLYAFLKMQNNHSCFIINRVAQPFPSDEK